MKNDFSGKTDKNGFEICICSRCGGTGNYSYNQLTGTRCFKCNGVKAVYTKRGRAALDYWRSLRSRPVEDLKIGDVIWVRGSSLPGCEYPSGWFPILGIETADQARARHEAGEIVAHSFHTAADGSRVLTFYTHIKTENLDSGHLPGDKLVVKSASPEEAREKLQQALDYQKTLTKSGKPRK